MAGHCLQVKKQNFCGNLYSILSICDLAVCITVVFRTIFTRFGRHNYVDADYSYTDEEMAAIEAHKNHYRQFINKLRDDRRERIRVKEHKRFNDDNDIGIKVEECTNTYTQESTAIHDALWEQC